MLFVLIDTFLEPLSPVRMRNDDDFLGAEWGMQPTGDRLVRQYYDNALSWAKNPRDEEEQC